MMTTLPAALRAPFSAGGATAIDAQLANRLLGLALEAGGDYADIYFEFRVSASYSLEEEQIRTLGRGITLGLGVRVTKGDATGYAFCEDLAWEKMAHAARTAGQIAVGGGHAPVGLAPIAPVALPSFYVVPTPSLVVSAQDKLALLRSADKAARAYDPRIVKVEASFAESIKEVLLFTSDGRMASDVQPLMRLGVRAVAEDHGKRQSGSGGGGGRYGMDYFAAAQRDATAHGREAARVAIAMLDARDAPAGEMPVVLGPGDSGILLHEAVGHGLEADFNRKQTSNYAGKVGTMVASELCTVVDDATLVGYRHDRLSARHYGIQATGNGRRESFAASPMPRMTNTVLLAGKDDPEEIVKSVKKGVYAKRFGGGQVDISNGDFVFSLTEGYLIEDGKITAPLKGVNLIGNGPETLREV